MINNSPTGQPAASDFLGWIKQRRRKLEMLHLFQRIINRLYHPHLMICAGRMPFLPFRRISMESSLFGRSSSSTIFAWSQSMLRGNDASGDEERKSNRNAETMITVTGINTIASTSHFPHDHVHAWLKYHPFRLFISLVKCPLLNCVARSERRLT